MYVIDNSAYAIHSVKMNQPHRKPTALELAWGLQPEARRGPRPSLSLAEVVAAAVELADAEGLEALSMQRLAGRLGVTTMALYRYVPSKEDLVLLAVDAAGAGAPDLPLAGEGWRQGLERWARAQDALLRRHPWIVRVPISTPPMGPGQVAWMEAFLRCLADTGLTPDERIGILNLVSGFVLQHRRLYDELARGAAAQGLTVEQAGSRYAELLARLLDPERHPEVRAAFVGDGAPSAGAQDADATDFEFGLATILDGVARLAQRRSPDAG